MIKSKHLSVQLRKSIMEQMMASPVAECMQTKLQAEGFLPLNEELVEGIDMNESFTTVMEDEETANEMFESLLEGDCKCSKHIKEWLQENEFFGGDDEEENSDDAEGEPEADTGTDSEPESTEDGETDAPAEPETETEPEGGVLDIAPAEEPSTDITPAAPETDALPTDAGTEGGGEMQTLIDTLVSLQTKFAGNEEDSEKLAQINGMLNQAKAIQGLVDGPDAPVAGISVDIATDEPTTDAPADVVPTPDAEPAIDAEPTVDEPTTEPTEPSLGDDIANEVGDDTEPSLGDEIEEALNENILDDIPTPAPKKGAGGATRQSLDADFAAKVIKFRDTYLDDLKWNSLKSYYNLSPQIQPEDIYAYLAPSEGEDNLGFYQRITNIHNDPTGINRMILNLANPSKRGYLAKFGGKYDPQVLDGMEDLLSDIFAKHQAMEAMIAGKNSPIPADDEDGPEGDDSGYAKDDFEDEFNANDDANIDAQAAQAAKAPKAPKADIAPDLGDEEGEEDLFEGEKPKMGDNVLSDNKTNAKENDAQAKEAIESQKTEDQKVDELKNQKFEASQAQGDIQTKMHGMNNLLDLDYDTEPSQAFKDRVLQQASGLAPKDHANVDHDSTAGQALIDAAKDRAPENEKQFTSVPDSTIVKDEEKYKVTTAVNEDIERMKKLMNFGNPKVIREEKKKKVDEDKFLVERVQKKKFL